MHIIGAIFGAIFTGLFWWIIFGNGKEAINHWLDQRNHEKRSLGAIRAREQEKRVAIRALTDPRDAAVAIMIAIAERRGTITHEQQSEIRARMRTVLGFETGVDQRYSIAEHAARAVTPEVVIDETVPLFHANLSQSEREELVAMVGEIAGLHGGATDAQAGLVERLRRSLQFSSGEVFMN